MYLQTIEISISISIYDIAHLYSSDGELARLKWPVNCFVLTTMASKLTREETCSYMHPHLPQSYYHTSKCHRTSNV